MLRDLKIRSYVLVIQGVLILGLGLVFLYLRANMTEQVFNVIDVGIAMMLTVAALIVGALADWIAAIGEGVEHFRRFAFYLLCGFGMLMACAFLAYSHYRTLALMLSFAGVHALVYSMSIFSFQLHHLHLAHHRTLLFVAGGVSLLFAIAMIFYATSNDDELATALIGAYLCFVGLRMLHQSWRLRGVFRHLAEHREGHEPLAS